MTSRVILSEMEVEAGCYGLAGYARHMTKCLGRSVHPEVIRLLRRLELERSLAEVNHRSTQPNWSRI
jgi:hypothetical protein